MTPPSPIDVPLPCHAGLRILLVEDNPGDADLIQARLRGAPTAVGALYRADRLAVAVDKLQAGEVDVVLLDLNLPDSEGIDTVLGIRKVAPHVPIVVLTGNTDHEMGLAAVHAGAQEFLAKGEATPDLLWRVLRYAIERQRGQKHVLDSEQFLQASLDALSGCVAILDADGAALFVNQPWATFVNGPGGRPEQCLGANYLAVCDEAAALGSEDTGTLAAGVRAVIAGTVPEFEMEYRNEAPREGTWLLIRITRFPGEGPVRVAVIHDDITGLKKAELREARLADVLRGVRHVNQLITTETDPQRLIQSACNTLVGALSYRSAWVLFFDGPDGSPLVGVAGAAEQVEGFAEQLRDRQWPACVERGLVEPGVAVVVDSATECPDCLLAGLRAGDRLVARLVDHGRVVGIMGVLTPSGLSVDPEERALFEELVEDIVFALNKIRLETEHLVSQRALVTSEERYRALFENAPIGIFETTLDGKAVQANPAMGEILGFSSTAEVGAHYRDLGAQLYADPGRRADFVRLLKRDGEVQDFEYEACRRDGHRLWLSMNARVYTPDPGGEARIEGFTRDITQRREVEARLVESERLYRLLADSTSDSIWLMDLGGNFEYLNPACQALLGYNPEEMVGTNLAQYCDEEALGFMLGEIERALASLPQREPVLLESTMLRRDGSSVPVEIKGRVVVDAAGNPVALQGMTRDITERVRATEELRASENLLSKIIDVLPVGLWLADGEGKLFRANPAGIRIWGAANLVGTEEYGVFKACRLPSREEIGPDDWALVHTLRDKVGISNELLEIDAFDGETRTILNSTAPVLNDAGEIEAVVVVNHDVTDLQRTQAERMRLLLAIEQSQETIVITDADGAIEYANPAFEATTGYSSGEAVGRNPRFLKSAQQDKAFYEDLWSTISRGAPWRGRFVNRRKDGGLYTEDASISPVMDDSGRIVNYVAVKRDISEE
ncbi:MAG: PAS domain S-box protein, partial [Victivallales bacterium]|nr:PAS domain S-box protein [Victivallales bacterium]